MGPRLITFGCRLNTYESEVMRGHAQAAGMDDAIIVNTCAVTAEATRQARQAIRKARRENPDARIIVTGCAAQIEPETFAAMEEVDQVLGNEEKLDAARWRPQAFGLDAFQRVQVNDIMEARETALHLIDGFEGRARAFVQVQNGCDHRCTFCIIPFGRGASRSVPPGAVVEQVRLLVENGYAEVVLTGVDITDYGRDLPGQPTLGRLVEAILRNVQELARLRLSSLDPVEIDDRLMRAIGEEERLMPHLHVSLQAGDDMILKRMKRRHSRDDAIRFCEAARGLRPDVVFGADIIAGFPTETEAMFQNTLAVVEECGLTHLHIFPFSPRPGTPAARMPQVPREVVKERARMLREASETMLQRHFAEQVGRAHRVLAENESMGRTEGFAPVEFARAVTPGAVIETAITGHTDRTLLAA